MLTFAIMAIKKSNQSPEGTMKHIPTVRLTAPNLRLNRLPLAGVGLAVALAALASLNAHAALLTWDSRPSNPGADDGNAGWGTVAANTNWWDGAANVP